MKESEIPQTPFELAQLQVKTGTLKTPDTSIGNKKVDYFGYQLAVSEFNLKIMSSGMSCRGVKLKDLKHYYGLKGKSAKDCLSQFLEIKKKYEEEKEKTVLN